MDAVQCEIMKVLLQRLLELGLIGETVYDRAAEQIYAGSRASLESAGSCRKENACGCSED